MSELRLSPEALQEIDRAVALYPRRASAVLPVLHVIQREHGYVPPEARGWVAARLEMPPAKVEEVLSFYTMFHRAPVGRKHLQVCRSLSCYLRGQEEITDTIRRKLGLEPGGKTADGKFSLVHVECLGSCGTAPMMQVNDDYHENLSPARVEELLEEWSR
jgi:NADH-quinone oxidoreductase E subunit